MLKQRLLVSIALVVFFPWVTAATAEDADCYTVASVHGTYAFIGTYDSHVAISLGLRHFDGNGNMTGTSIINEPTPGSTTGARTILTTTQVGTYTINCDGTGVITRTITVSNGVVVTQIDDLLITAAVVKHDHLLATAMSDAQRVPSAVVPGGVLLTRSYTRRPDQSPEHER